MDRPQLGPGYRGDKVSDLIGLRAVGDTDNKQANKH